MRNIEYYYRNNIKQKDLEIYSIPKFQDERILMQDTGNVTMTFLWQAQFTAKCNNSYEAETIHIPGESLGMFPPIVGINRR